MKINIHFIVNPIAGSGKNRLSAGVLEAYFPTNEYSIVVKETAFIMHATALTNSSINEGAQIIVACGGDGTINEVASCLVNSEVILGILPMGSGNGLASNLKIPRNIGNALQIIKSQKVMVIDTGTINGEPFFSNTGIGFDAHVISDFAEGTTRRLFSYIKSTLKTLKTYHYKNIVELKYNQKTELIAPFLLFVSNSNEMGYRMSLTPRASLHDGLLDVVLVPKLSAPMLFLFTILFLFKKHHWLKQVRFLQVKSLSLKSVDNVLLKAQKDGEFLVLKDSKIEIAIHPQNLKVCTSQ